MKTSAIILSLSAAMLMVACSSEPAFHKAERAFMEKHKLTETQYLTMKQDIVEQFAYEDLHDILAQGRHWASVRPLSQKYKSVKSE